jgi:hypothetical protein
MCARVSMHCCGMRRCPEVAIAEAQAQNTTQVQDLIDKYLPTLAAISTAVNQTYGPDEDVVGGAPGRPWGCILCPSALLKVLRLDVLVPQLSPCPTPDTPFPTVPLV